MQSPSSSVAAHGSGEHLVQMANDIGNFFRSEPERKDGIAGIANHIAKFWTPRMRQKLLATQSPASRPREAPGGDAG
jgi:hypothetical protein